MLTKKYLTHARLSVRRRKLPASRNWTACKEGGGGIIFNKGLKWAIAKGESANAWNNF